MTFEAEKSRVWSVPTEVGPETGTQGSGAGPRAEEPEEGRSDLQQRWSQQVLVTLADGTGGLEGLLPTGDGERGAARS